MARTNICDFGDDSDPDRIRINPKYFAWLYCTKYRINFNEIWWTCSVWANDKPVRFWWWSGSGYRFWIRIRGKRLHPFSRNFQDMLLLWIGRTYMILEMIRIRIRIFPDTYFGSGSGGNGLTHIHEIFRLCCSYEKVEHTWFWRWSWSGYGFLDPDPGKSKTHINNMWPGWGMRSTECPFHLYVSWFINFLLLFYFSE